MTTEFILYWSIDTYLCRVGRFLLNDSNVRVLCKGVDRSCGVYGSVYGSCDVCGGVDGNCSIC